MGKIRKTDRRMLHELNDGQMEKRKTTWQFTRSVQSEVIFASYSYREWKVNLFWKTQAQKIMGRPMRTIHIDRNTESLWQKTMFYV